jgi:hypothetical protein
MQGGITLTEQMFFEGIMRSCVMCRRKTPESKFHNKTTCIECWRQYKHQEFMWKQQLVHTGYSNGISMLNPIEELSQEVEDKLRRLNVALDSLIQKDGYREPPDDFIKQILDLSESHLPRAFSYPVSTVTFYVIMLRDKLDLPRCFYCGVPIAVWNMSNDPRAKIQKYGVSREIITCPYPEWSNSLRQHTTDHLVPEIRGGSPRDFQNLVMACAECNGSKGQLTGYEFMQWGTALGKTETISNVDTEYMLYVQGRYKISPPKLKRDFTKLRQAGLLDETN